jgi:hypothetical protein
MEAALKGYNRYRKRRHGAARNEPAQFEDGPGRQDLAHALD